MSNDRSKTKPKLFIGSSSGGINVANEMQLLLNDDAECHVWKQESWLGKNTLQNLLDFRDRFDFFLLIFRPDDKTEIRDQQQMTTRDNVLFETGLFMGKHGPEKTFIAFQQSDAMRIPSDLQGLNFAPYKTESTNDLGVAAHLIRKKMLQVWKEEKEKPSKLDDVTRIKKEAAMLYRILNSVSYPQYKAIDSDLLKPLNLVGDKSFKNIADVRTVVGELFDHYILPHFSQRESERMRVYFAYYLGDGAPFAPGADPRFCACKDDSGARVEGAFVIGISNSSENFPEPNWRSGLTLGGYAQVTKGKALSNTAEAFRSREAQIIVDTEKLKPNQQHLNFKVANERTVYSIPVLLSDTGWFTQSMAPIGVLTISGSEPHMIDPTIISRAEHLSLILGFIFYFHSLQNPDNPKVSLGAGQDSPVGLSGASPQFIDRAVSLRREIAAHFENYFIENEFHQWDGKELSTTLSPY